VTASLMTQPVVTREASRAAYGYQAVATEVPAMARCGRCKAVRRVAVVRVTRPGGKDSCGITRIHTTYRYPDVTCCGKSAGITPIRGTFNAAVPCSAKCQSATGFDCECSCHGENHGKAHI
jgi:hypothetical protein